MNKNKKITITLFEVYILLLIWIILFKTSFSVSEIIDLSKERSTNLIPFYYPHKLIFI